MRHGFTLPELLLVLCLTGILLLVAVPRIGQWQDRIAIDNAARRAVGAYGRARLLAITRGQKVTLLVTAESLTVRLPGDSLAPSLWGALGPSADGVQLQEPAIRRASFVATGLAWGVPNATLVFRRGAATRSVVVSRLGRVRIRAP